MQSGVCPSEVPLKGLGILGSAGRAVGNFDPIRLRRENFCCSSSISLGAILTCGAAGRMNATAKIIHKADFFS
jgi:hypothetical protein